MTSFRRTLSLAQRDGPAHNGEAFSISSPSPNPPYTHNYTPFGGRLATFFGSMNFVGLVWRIRAFALSICSRRSSRTLERSKPKGHVWKRAFIHFFLCFMVGLFIGLTPFILVDFSVNLVSEHQAFSFGMSSPDGHATRDFDKMSKRGSLLENREFTGKVRLGLDKELESSDGMPNAAYLAPSPILDSDFVDRKLLIVVTPTYPRALQAYYLNRLAHTLRLIPPPLLWIVVEMPVQSTETAEVLRRTGVVYRHLVCEKNLTGTKDRGVHQRNMALSHIEEHHLDGIVYFADDDNVYTVDLFEQMRQTRRFGTWPVALLTESKNRAILEGPVCNGSQVIGWHTNEKSKRMHRFYVDMSGFAFNSTILWDPKRWRRPTIERIRQLDTVKEGFQETMFIEQVVEDEGQMEGLPNGCSKIMVWHLHLEAPELIYPQGWFMQKNLDVIAPLM